MRLWIVRHGDAGKPSADPTQERSRGLTNAGRRAVEAVAANLKKTGEEPRVILASPFTRTMQTADIVGKALGVPVEQEDALQPQRPLYRYLLGLLRGGATRVMLVGHHDNLVPMLEDADPDVGDVDKLEKGECRRFKVDRLDGSWTEKARVTPSSLGVADGF